MVKYLDLAEKAIRQRRKQILIIKANGGWKYRQEIELPDLELRARMPKAEGDLVEAAVRLAIAEQMLSEPPPSIHARADEYEQRVEDVLREMRKNVER